MRLGPGLLHLVWAATARIMQRLQRGWPPQTAPSANHRQSLCGRRGLVVQASEGPKLLPLLATAAAIGATAVTVRHVLVQRQRPQQQGAPAPQRQQLRRELGGEALASQQVQGLGFGWPLQSKEAKKERQLLTTVRAPLRCTCCTCHFRRCRTRCRRATC